MTMEQGPGAREGGAPEGAGLSRASAPVGRAGELAGMEWEGPGWAGQPPGCVTATSPARGAGR